MRLALALAIVCTVAATGARAATQGNRLLLNRPCLADGTTVSIVADASLSHAIDVEGVIANLSTDVDLINVVGACLPGGELTIRVPPAFPITIDSRAQGDLRLGDLNGPLVVHLQGPGDLEAGRLGGGLTFDNGGPGDARIGQLSGAAVLNIHGPGDLAIGRVDSSAVTVNDGGAGDVQIGGGQIGHLVATMSASGDLDVGATVGGGEVVSTAMGDISIARVLGDLVETQTGSGDITVHARGAGGSVPATLAVPAIPAVPPMPAMPKIDFGQVALSSRHRGGNTFIHVLTVLAIVGGVIVFLRRRRRRRQSMAWVARDPRVAATADRLEILARRVGRIEALVTSREFELNRSFREIGD